MNLSGVRGELVSDREAREIDAMFASIDNLHKKQEKTSGATNSKVLERAKRSARTGRVRPRTKLPGGAKSRR